MNGKSGQLRRLGISVVAVGAAFALVPAIASAEVRSGSGTDPAGDASPPQRDITAGELSYDTNGAVAGKVTFAAAPDAAALAAGVGVMLGTWNGQACDIKLFAHASPAGGNRVFMSLIGPSGEQRLAGVPSLTAAGSTVTVTASDPAIANQPFNCGGAEASDPAAPDVRGDLQTVIPSLTAVAPPPSGNTPPPSSKPGKKLRKAIKSCRRKHKGSKPRVKSKRKRCIRRAHKKHDAAG